MTTASASDLGPGGPDVVLDLRDLPPPEPLQRALEAMSALPVGRRLVVRTRFRPAYLIDQLVARGWSHSITAQGAGVWETAIWRLT